MDEKKPYWFDVICRPFDFDEIDIKVQSTNVKKGEQAGSGAKALPVAYFDARVVRRRLTEAFAAENWTATHREIFDAQGRLVGVVCRLECKVIDAQGNLEYTVVREEVGVPSNIDPIKGAYSDALKRAFAALGNDWLYEISLGWYPYTGKPYAPFAPEWIEKMRTVYEDQIQNVKRERVYYDVEDAPRPEKAALGTKSILDRVANGRGEAFAEEVAEAFSDEKIGKAPADTVDPEPGEIIQGGLL